MHFVHNWRSSEQFSVVTADFIDGIVILKPYLTLNPLNLSKCCSNVRAPQDSIISISGTVCLPHKSVKFPAT